MSCVLRPLILFCATVLECTWLITTPHVIILCPHSYVLRLDVCGVECNIPARTGFPQLFQLCVLQCLVADVM